MKAENMKFLYAGILIALVLSVLAPFLASSDPDGLESAAEGVIEESKMAELEEMEPVVGAPMPDYAIAGMGKSGEIAAIVLGTLLVLGISFGFGKLFNKKV
ncbi:MAG: PDGLE domain-containing protein [Methanosarcinaceae archaeon]|nr:PDGLE domain-containing protein [Methanosarcinaceae archaeon]MDD4331776.1 PDGLE domain-containing protein [Methanosarcinaceae archaeon]MDD4748886.1 PDGLE domain-containing protein [Methanosarcinaceae archaeon]